MKSRIRWKLFIYFAASLLVFSILIGLFFAAQFSKYNMEIHKKELEERAISIADALSSYTAGGHMRMGMGMGRGSYMMYLDELTSDDIWVVDPELKQIVRGHGQSGISYRELPENAEIVIAEALSGKTSFSENFSIFLTSPSVTVATPIILSDGSIPGAVLMHTQLEDITSATKSGLWMLGISMFLAVIIAFAIAGLLSTRFTKPLERMKMTAEQISSGNYDISTGITQPDEIGELAVAMDIMSTQLNHASKESERLDKLRRDFISNISHELRTPVTVLRGSLEALIDGVVTEPEKTREYYKQMLSESLHLEHLVGDLLDLSKLQNPDFKMEMDSLDLRDVVHDSVWGIKEIAQKKNVEIEMLTVEKPFDFYGDYVRLRQMITIVLDNAVKFTSANSIVVVNLNSVDNEYLITVEDNGPGIGEDELEHIFDRFYKQRSEDNKTGSGIGLSIAREIAERHKIEMVISSEIGIGTKVSFKITRGDSPRGLLPGVKQ